MLVAVATPLIAVAIGTAMALAGGARPRVLAPVRSFALAAVLIAIATHILPEAIAGGGLPALAVFAAGLLLPGLLSRVLAGDADGHAHAGLATGLGLLGVLVHQLGDGLALGAFTGEAHADHVHWDLVLGIAAHTVPLAAVVAVTAAARRGARAALVLAGALAGATLVGLALARIGGAELGGEVAPWINAGVAGLLVHVLTHDAPAPPRTAMVRTVELVAIVAGVALPLAIAVEHGEHGHDVVAPSLAAFAPLAATLAPVLLAGAAAAVLLARHVATASRRAAATGPAMVRALRGAVAPAPAPICAGTPEVGAAAMPSGAARLGVLVGGPELGLTTIALTVALLGWQVALVRVLAALAMVALLGTLGGGVSTPAPAAASSAAPRRRDVLDEHVLHTTAWVVIGLASAALVFELAPSGMLTSHGWATDLALALAAAVTGFVCAPAATPLAAALSLVGALPTSVAIAAVVVGGATNAATRAAVGPGLPRRAALLALAVVGGIGIAGALEALALVPRPLVAAAPGPIAWTCLTVLAALLLRALWRYGLAAWLEPLHGGDHAHHQHADGAPCTVDCHDHPAIVDGHGDGHGHGHGHQAHGHAHEHAHHHHAHEHAHEHDPQHRRRDP
ncbi:MAG: hypothetical protein R2939_22250 [Kofleriaceae bacterium]